jgi:hypothetical protein
LKNRCGESRYFTKFFEMVGSGIALSKCALHNDMWQRISKSAAVAPFLPRARTGTGAPLVFIREIVGVAQKSDIGRHGLIAVDFDEVRQALHDVDDRYTVWLSPLKIPGRVPHRLVRSHGGGGERPCRCNKP